MLMPTRKLEIRCARVAARAGKFLAFARAIIEPEIAYFVELRERLNAQGRRGGIEGWQRWCERHFSCDVRTVNRALSSILGPEKERKKTRNWRAPAEALLEAVDPAIRLARRHLDKDPDAAEFLNRLKVEDLNGLISEPEARSDSPLDKLNKERRVKKDELYEMGQHLALAVMEGASAVNGAIPEGKRIIGLAKHMLEIKKGAGELTVYQPEPQDSLSRTPGTNFVMDDDELNTAMAMVAPKKVEDNSKVKPGLFSISRVGGSIAPSNQTAWLRPGGLAGLDGETLGDPQGKDGGWVFKVNSLTLDAEYERVALNMWVIPHNEAAKEHCAVYYEKQPKAKHILGDGGPLCIREVLEAMASNKATTNTWKTATMPRMGQVSASGAITATGMSLPSAER